MNMKELEQAYTEAMYYVYPDEGEPINLIVGRTNQKMDSLLLMTETREYVITTAWNPRSRPLTPEENKSRQSSLIESLEQYITLPAFSCGHNWEGEDMIAVMGMSLGEGILLANQYEQNGILFGVLSGSVGLYMSGWPMQT